MCIRDSPQATRIRRLALAGLAVVALAAGLALSPSLTQPGAGPSVGHPAHQEQP